MRRTSLLNWGPWLIALACLGCGAEGPDVADVEGTVTMDGKPLANATVLFIPEGGRPAAATTDENGHYVLTFSEGREGAIPGKSKVQISTLRGPGETPEGEPIPGTPETIPMKYNAQTELTFEVKEGQSNVADFKLDSEGELPPETPE